MKIKNLILALGLTFCLVSCGNQPKTNESVTNGNASETPVVTDEVQVAETPFDWDALKIGSEIPEKMDGFTVEPVTYMAEGEEQIKYAIKKDGELLAELEPDYDFEKNAFTNTISVINIYSDKYQSEKNFHVGSNVSDVLATYSDLLTSLTAMGDICLDADGTQFMVALEDFDGKLPEVTSDEGAIIKNPSFKPEAKVKMIRIY
jgi:hypothetical protein